LQVKPGLRNCFVGDEGVGDVPPREACNLVFCRTKGGIVAGAPVVDAARPLHHALDFLACLGKGRRYRDNCVVINKYYTILTMRWAGDLCKSRIVDAV
jgi:hypothetical protein